MKLHRSFHPLLILVSLSVLCSMAQAAARVAVADGDWSNSSTWNDATVPAPGDSIIIPVLRTVSVTSNISYGSSAMRLRIFGTLTFIGGNSRLSFPCGSIIEILAPWGAINGNTGGNSQTIKICGSTVWSVGANNNATGYASYPSNAALPVELLYFRGNCSVEEVALEWATASERNSSYFEVKRSQDADTMEWNIATVPAAGSSSDMTRYAVHDRPGHGGVWYYHLLQYDLDGQQADLGKVAVIVSPGQGIHCFPVPASDKLEVQLSSPGAHLLITDALGHVVQEETLAEDEGTLDVSGLPEGIYLVHCKGDQVADGQRIVIMR